jgi:transglutaminase-like putative cysteine protease
MRLMNEVDILAAQNQQFIEESIVDWRNAHRARFLFYQCFYYEYSGPIRDLKQRLIIIPAERPGIQHVRDHFLAIDPPPTITRETTDSFGNRVLELELLEADRAVSFEIVMLIESETHTQHRPSIDPGLAAYFLQPTPLTTPDKHIEAVARQLQDEATTSYDLAQRISDWVYGTMCYQSGMTTVDTTAAESLALGQGLCQDYAHLMLALCREAHLPARYVSGHLPGKGGSHAWVEVFLPTDQGLELCAFDPTNNRRPHLGYITVAVGRDYRDVSPTSGSFTAPYRGRLISSKRAGLTLIEYSNGTTLHSQPMP